MTFDEHCADLRDRIFPTGDHDDLLNDVLVDAQFLRDLMSRYGSCRLWCGAYRDVLRHFADDYRALQHEAAYANQMGHEYPMEDDDHAEVVVMQLRMAFELMEASKPPRRKT